MVTQSIDGISFQLKKEHDLSFLSRYGQVFRVFSHNDSGNISFGVRSGNQKYFIKIAGVNTARSSTSTQKSIEILKAAMPIYTELEHPNLIQLVEHYSHNDVYVAVFKWAEGDCLFDYWNFEKYKCNAEESPRERFKKLTCQKKLDAFDILFEFLSITESKGYVAVDFYDGSIMYDFECNVVTICDIDFFRKKPAVNDMGADFWGTKRLKSPEEYILGAQIDTDTNVFTLGALLFHFFGTYSGEEIKRMSDENAFFPCRFEAWELSKSLYDVALRAVSYNRLERYASIKSFYQEWQR